MFVRQGTTLVLRAHFDDPLTEACINAALPRGDDVGQCSVTVGPPFRRRENGLDNRLGPYKANKIVVKVMY